MATATEAAAHVAIEPGQPISLRDARLRVRHLAAMLLANNANARLHAPAGSTPRLAPAPSDPFTHVSFSHTRTGVAAAVGSMPIGVDIESIRRRINWQRLAETYFSPAERAELLRQPPGRRRHAFLVLWTCKEAWLKAHGWGLAHIADAAFTPAAAGGWIAPGADWHTLSRRWGEGLIVSVVWRGPGAPLWWYSDPDGRLIAVIAGRPAHPAGRAVPL